MSNLAQPLIGIDLGTSTSEIAVLRNNRPELIQDERGDRVIPSVVQLAPDGQIIVGGIAKNGVITFADRTVQEVKRLMGSDTPITLGDSTFRPEEISAMILRYLVEAAEARLGLNTVHDVVISVPARFDNPAREATKRAAELTGLNVVRLINEPTAAALSYGLDHIQDEQRVLVFDFGGGTLDVTVLEMLEGVLDVKTSVGDDRLGGSDIDTTLIDFLKERYQEKFGVPLDPTDRKAASFLKEGAERYKKELSVVTSVLIDFPYLSAKGGITDLKLTRAEFEQMCRPLLERAMNLVDDALARAQLTYADIDVILPVGGSSRIPLFRRALETRWGKPIQEFDNPDEAVARGAAITAGIAADTFTLNEIQILDVAPHRLGTDVLEEVEEGEFVDNFFSEIIAKDAKLPATGSRTYATVHDGQTAVNISIFEAVSDSNLCDDHRMIGEMRLENIPPAPAGQPIEVEFRYTLDGMLHATAQCVYDPDIQIDGNFAIVGRGNVEEMHETKRIMEKLWQDSDDVKRCTPLLDQAEMVQRQNPEVAAKVQKAADSLRSALATGDREATDHHFNALSDLLFELS